MDIVINHIVGAIIGALVSFSVSWYFFKKADIPARAAAENLDKILFTLIQGKLGVNLTYSVAPDSATLPKNKDTPHIVRFWYSAKAVKQGECVSILFRVVDTGMNHYYRLLEVIEESSRLSFPVTREGHGYFTCTVNFEDDAAIGHHIISFTLTDRIGNTHTQVLHILVEPQ